MVVVAGPVEFELPIGARVGHQRHSDMLGDERPEARARYAGLAQSRHRCVEVAIEL